MDKQIKKKPQYCASSYVLFFLKASFLFIELLFLLPGDCFWKGRNCVKTTTLQLK